MGFKTTIYRLICIKLPENISCLSVSKNESEEDAVIFHLRLIRGVQRRVLHPEREPRGAGGGLREPGGARLLAGEEQVRPEYF